MIKLSGNDVTFGENTVSQSGQRMLTRSGVRGRGLSGNRQGRIHWNGHRFPPLDATGLLYLVGYPAQGSVIQDFSGGGRDGTIVGASWQREPSGIWSLSYDGVNDRLSYTTDDFAVAAATVELWYWPDNQVTPTGDGAFIWSYGVDHTDRVGLRDSDLIDGTLTLFDDINNDGATTEVIEAARWDNVMRQAWHHMVTTITATNKAVYVDAVEELAPDGSDHSLGDIGAGAKFHIGNLVTTGGAESSNSYVKGRIALLRIYSSVLSTAVIYSHYQRERHLFGV